MLARSVPHLMVVAVAAAQFAQAQAPIPRDQQENFLRVAKVVKSRGLGQGITNSIRLTLSDGKYTHDAHLQTIDVTKAQMQLQNSTEINFRDCYKFNIAAYKLDRLLDLNMVPVSVERKVDGKSGAVTWWVDEAAMTELERTKQKLQPPDVDAWNRQMWVVRVFDQLIYNTDRNLGNLVATKDWNLWMIDHTRAFRIHRNLLSQRNLEKCEKSLLEKLRNLQPDVVMKELRPWLTQEEVKALLARRDAIVSYFDQQVATRGEAAVLYELAKH